MLTIRAALVRIPGNANASFVVKLPCKEKANIPKYVNSDADFFITEDLLRRASALVSVESASPASAFPSTTLNVYVLTYDGVVLLE